MQQFSSLLSWRLFAAQRVSGVLPPIIRSSMTAAAASGLPSYRGDRRAVFVVGPVITNVRIINWKTCIWLVIYLSSTMMYGLTNPKKNYTVFFCVRLCITPFNHTSLSIRKPSKIQKQMIILTNTGHILDLGLYYTFVHKQDLMFCISQPYLIGLYTYTQSFS
jgi:hypothetical protein